MNIRRVSPSLGVLVVAALFLAWGGLPASTADAVLSEPPGGPAPAGAPLTGILVNTTSDELDNDGNCSLREAIQAANLDLAVDACPAGQGHDTIILPAGLYILTRAGGDEDDNATGDLDVKSDLAIAGGGAGITVIDGNALDRVLEVHAGATAYLAGQTVRNGKTPDGKDDPSVGGNSAGGGGIAIHGSLIVTDCAVSQNATGDGGNYTGYTEGLGWGGNAGVGGGILNDGNLTLVNSIVNGNRAGNGGIGGYGQDPTPGNGGWGGGIHNNGVLTATHSIISDNMTGYAGAAFRPPGSWCGSPGSGGGISNYGHMTGNQLTIKGNLTSDGCGGSHSDGQPGGDGGGVYNYGTLMLEHSTVNANQTGNGGVGFFGGAAGGSGGGIASFGRLWLSNSTVSGNHTGYGGGAILGLSGPDGNGGGIYNGHTATLNNVTVSANGTGLGASRSEAGDGGGVFNQAGLVMRNTLLAGNSATQAGPDCAGSLSSQGYNLVQDASNCVIGGDTTGDITGVDPRLSPLADNGGPTWTHALLPGSPAAEAGSCTDTAGMAVISDQRGVSRPQGPRCEIGAYEAFSSVYLPQVLR
jgi:CSLREA domain-containing protein